MHGNRAQCMIVMVALTAAACAPSGSEAAERRVDSAGRRDSIAAAAASSMSEGQVLGLLAATQADDSALGALGVAMAASQEVKDFGRMIEREHHALRQEALQVGEKLGLAVQPPTVPPDQPSTDARNALRGAKAGAVWDNAYLDYAVAVHQSAFENTARALAATRQPEVKTYIERSVPILQKHLDKAKVLKKRVVVGPAATKPKSDSATIAKKGAPLTGAHSTPTDKPKKPERP